jgi:hypothetical protein
LVAPSHSRPRLRKVRSNHRSGRPSRGSGSGRNAAEPNRLATGSNNLGRDASPNRTLPTRARHRVLDPSRPVQSALPAEQHERRWRPSSPDPRPRPVLRGALAFSCHTSSTATDNGSADCFRPPRPNRCTRRLYAPTRRDDDSGGG